MYNTITFTYLELTMIAIICAQLIALFISNLNYTKNGVPKKKTTTIKKKGLQLPIQQATATNQRPSSQEIPTKQRRNKTLTEKLS